MIKNVSLDDGAELSVYKDTSKMLSPSDFITYGYDTANSFLSSPKNRRYGTRT